MSLNFLVGVSGRELSNGLMTQLESRRPRKLAFPLLKDCKPPLTRLNPKGVKGFKVDTAHLNRHEPEN